MVALLLAGALYDHREVARHQEEGWDRCIMVPVGQQEL